MQRYMFLDKLNTKVLYVLLSKVMKLFRLFVGLLSAKASQTSECLGVESDN